MSTVELVGSALVPAPPDRVWDLLCDTRRYAEWVVGTEAVTRTDGPARPGSTYDEINPIFGPWKARATWTVVEFDPARRQVHRTQDIPIAGEFLVIMEVAPTGEVSTVTLTLRGTSSLGPLGAGVFAALRERTRRDNERTVHNLAALARTELTS